MFDFLFRINCHQIFHHFLLCQIISSLYFSIKLFIIKIYIYIETFYKNKFNLLKCQYFNFFNTEILIDY